MPVPKVGIAINPTLSLVILFLREVTANNAYESPRDNCDTCHVPQNPYYDVYDDNTRCGRGASVRGSGAEAWTVDASDELAFWSSLTADLSVCSASLFENLASI